VKGEKQTGEEEKKDKSK
jgi:hypothetical protein